MAKIILIIFSYFSLVLSLSNVAKANMPEHELNIGAYEFVDRIGISSFALISGFGNYLPPPDCHRIWAGKSPLGNFMVEKEHEETRAVTMTRDICDDWASDVSKIYNSFGYNVDPIVFTAPGLTERYMKTRPDYKRWKSRHADFMRSSMNDNPPSGRKFCYRMPKEPQIYEPELMVLRELVDVENWYWERTGATKTTHKSTGDATMDSFARMSEQKWSEQGRRQVFGRACIPYPG